MKILQVSTIIEWRGGDKQMLTTYNILKNFPDLHQIILCPKNSVLEGKCKAAEIPVYTAARNSKFSRDFLKTIIEAIKREKIDVLHVHDSTALTLSLFALNFSPKVKLVYSRKRNNKISVNFFKKLKYNNPKITKIICVSEAVKDVLKPVMKDMSKVQVIYDGIDVENYSGKQNQFLLHKEFDLSSDTTIIGNIAGLTKQKDIFTFLDAAKLILASSKENIRFLIIGEGELKEQLGNYASSLGISDKVIFAGFRNDVPDVLPEFDIFLISSETEGLPLSILEAFACKVPVVATAAGGTGEAVKNEITGMISPVKDPEALAANTLKLLNNPDLKETITENAHELVNNKFTLEVMQREYYDFYKSLEN